MSKLVIVESPTKTKSLSAYLGKGFVVTSSRGHVRDLPKSGLGVDVEHNFEPTYEIMKGKDKVVKELKASAKKADEIFLAMDPDREGEAIAYHIAQLLKGRKGSARVVPNYKRVVFHEITKEAVKEAFKHPHGLDENLIDAWRARRVLDRLVGYKLSPLLWKKIRYGLSAGRVQSVAVRLIVEREKEREKFEEKAYFVIEGEFGFLTQASKHAPPIYATLIEYGQKKVFKKHKLTLFASAYTYQNTIFKDKSEVENILSDLAKQNFQVTKIEKKEVKKYPSPPLTTASLQRTAASSFGFTAKRTMRAAQSLYEQGLITYHRTDSTYLAQSALQKMRRFIKEKFGDKFLNPAVKVFKTKTKAAQEAHEAIRPTAFEKISSLEPKILAIGKDEWKLYQLIWRRAMATQFKPAVFDATNILIASQNNNYLFETKGSVLKFEGYLALETGSLKLKVDKETEEESRREKSKDQPLPNLTEGQTLRLLGANALDKQTSPPPRYNEGSLIRDLEKHGIGRPSTYAPIIATIEGRGYVEKTDGKTFVPTDTGKVVNDLLTEHFPKIVDLQFTAKMEADLDEIANGDQQWVPVIKDFYGPFAKKLKLKEKELKKDDFTRLKKLDEKCPECGKGLIIKLGRFGKFISCSAYPKCEYARPFADENMDETLNKTDAEQLSEPCPKCEGQLVLKEGRFGKFVACTNYPKCKFTKDYLDKIDLKCPKCRKGEVVVKRTRRKRMFWGCSLYPKCKWASWKNPKEEALPKETS